MYQEITSAITRKIVGEKTKITASKDEILYSQDQLLILTKSYSISGKCIIGGVTGSMSIFNNNKNNNNNNINKQFFKAQITNKVSKRFCD